MNKNFFEIINASFKVGGEIKVNNISFSIENEGDIICLLGPSGIGKTTILRSIAGLEKIETGSIKLKGKTLSSNQINTYGITRRHTHFYLEILSGNSIWNFYLEEPHVQMRRAAAQIHVRVIQILTENTSKIFQIEMRMTDCNNAF